MIERSEDAADEVGVAAKRPIERSEDAADEVGVAAKRPSFLAELRRRNVIRMAGLYLVGAWLVVQVASTVFPAFELPVWALRAVILLLAIGFIPALILAWVFELTPEGVKRDGEAPADAAIARGTARKMDRAIVIGLVVVIALLAVERVWFAKQSLVETPPTDATATRVDSIAVLPFRNESSGSDSEYLADGLAESLIYRLAQLPELTVSPASSVFRYKNSAQGHQEVGRALGVVAVLAGRLVQRGDNLTISIELIDVRDNRVVWGEQYQRPMSALLETQRDIAAEIVNRLELRLSAADASRFEKRFTDSNEAYRLYLEGRYHWNQRTDASIRQAIERFRAAVDVDPDFALAFSGLADCFLVLPYYRSVRSDETLRQAKAYAERALAIDAQLAEAHASTAYVDQGLWNWESAERGYQRALEINPRYVTALLWYARLEARLGRATDSLTRLREAQALEPLSRVVGDNTAQMLLILGQFEAARDEAQRMVRFDDGFPGGYQRLSQAQLKLGLPEEALATAEQGLQKWPWDQLSINRAAALAALGRRDEARMLALELEATYAAGNADAIKVAEIHAAAGDANRAFEWLQRALVDRSTLLVDIPVLVELQSLSDDPRFAAILAAMGMPE